MSRILCRQIALIKQQQALYNITFCYFPISFRQPKDDPYGIGPDQLRTALRYAYTLFCAYKSNTLQKLSLRNAFIWPARRSCFSRKAYGRHAHIQGTFVAVNQLSIYSNGHAARHSTNLDSGDARLWVRLCSGGVHESVEVPKNRGARYRFCHLNISLKMVCRFSNLWIPKRRQKPSLLYEQSCGQFKCQSQIALFRNSRSTYVKNALGFCENRRRAKQDLQSRH